MLAVAFLVLGTACARAPEQEARGPVVYVWAGDADTASPDFLAVIDADTASDTYGSVLTTVPVDTRANGPHHTEYELRGRTLFANGWGSGRNYIFDVSDARQPRVTGTFSERDGYRYAHSFARLPNGNVLATFQTKGAGYTATGGLVELDSAGNAVRSVSGVSPDVPANETWTYSLLVLPDLDRVVTTNTQMGAPRALRAAAAAEHAHVSGEVASSHVQIWRLSDLRLLSTLRLPPQEGGHHQYVAEPRRLANGEVYVNTFTCGLYRIVGVASERPSVEPALASPFRDPGYCAVPVVVGNFWIHPSATENAIVSYDLSNPAQPREASRVTLDSTRPDVHWLGLDSAGSRIIVTANAPWAMMLKVDRATGALSIDERFRDAGASAPGITFDRASWPHGATGQAKPHGAVFGGTPTTGRSENE